MKFEWWETMDATAKGLIQLFVLLTAFLGGGKVIRVNRADAANTDANVAATKTEEAAANSITSEIARLSALVKEYGTKIEALTTQVQALKEELNKVHSGRATALVLLRNIKLCGTCVDQYGVLLQTAIEALDSEETGDATHGQ